MFQNVKSVCGINEKFIQIMHKRIPIQLYENLNREHNKFPLIELSTKGNLEFQS